MQNLACRLIHGAISMISRVARRPLGRTTPTLGPSLAQNPSMSSSSPLRWSSAALTHVGMVRRLNEDAFLDHPTQGDHTGLWAVADGMGGHEAGDVASQLIISQLKQLPAAAADAGPTFISAVRQCLMQVNQQLRDESVRRYNSRVIGSTVVALVIDGQRATGLWVGDSRLYRLRQGRLEQLSHDHSHVQELVDQNIISAEEALRHPLGNVITRAVGSDGELQVDSVSRDVQPDDLFLLCTDGLNKMLLDHEIHAQLVVGSPQKSAKNLLRLALDRGASDNVTVAVVAIHGGDRLEDTADEDDTTVIMRDSLADQG